MLFNSIEFAIFLPIVFLIYWVIAGYAPVLGCGTGEAGDTAGTGDAGVPPAGKISAQARLRLQNAFIVVASYIFYGWWDWRFLLLIAFTSFCSWGSGLLIKRAAIQRQDVEILRSTIGGG